MKVRVLILAGLLLATTLAGGCGWRRRANYQCPPPCCPQQAALLPAVAVPSGPACCP